MDIHKPMILDVDGQGLLPGRMVLYQTDGRNGLSYTLPAIVTVTAGSHPGDYPDGRRNPLPAPDEDATVHLTVLTPGGVGTVVEVDDSHQGRGPYHSSEADSFPDALRMDVSKAAGAYVEHNVPYDAEGSPRSWRWMR